MRVTELDHLLAPGLLPFVNVMSEPLPGGLVPILDCPCGFEHLMNAARWVLYKRAVHGHPPVVAIQVKGQPGVFMVPRLYIACHQMKGGDVVWLADLYGWEVRRPQQQETPE